jgi:plastocyanin
MPGLIIAVAMLSACGGGSGGDSGGKKTATPVPSSFRRADVEMRDFSFNPTSFDAPKGRPYNITATNSGSTRHTLNVYKDAAFTLPLSVDAHIELEPGAAQGLFVKFDDVTTYYYRCEIHPQQMQGQIHVKESF